MERYNEESIQDKYCVSIKIILEYYSFVLNEKTESARERQQLKQKLIILENIYQLINYFTDKSSDKELYFLK